LEDAAHAYVLISLAPLRFYFVFRYLRNHLLLLKKLNIAIDTAKTVLQIDSVEGFRSLMRRVKAGRIGLLYSGAIANAISAVLGHYPWVR
jgi:hypothetical protein